MSDDFKNHPKSITELRAEKEEDASKWTPRDALISVLRDIDSGETSPDALVICYHEKLEGGHKTSYVSATPNLVIALGLMDRTAFKMNSDT